MNALAPMLWLASSFGALFLIAELLYRITHVRAEYTRKLVHAGTGILTLLFPLVLTEVWQVALLCGSFLLILVVSMRAGWLPSINAVQRKTAGSWLYPIIVLFGFVFYRHMAADAGALFRPLYYFYLPVLLLAFCDPAAALAGAQWKKRHPEAGAGKTRAGSLAFWVLASIICVGFAALFTKHILPFAPFVFTGLITAFAAMAAERFSDKGWDNFTIPAAAMLCMYATDYAL